MNERKLNKVTGEEVREWYGWLAEEGEGCCNITFANNAKYVYSVCMGWHDTGDGWRIAWKIGRQTPNNCMQTDLDIDFEMPYDSETGEVDDTLELVKPGEEWTDDEWEALAEGMRSTAIRIWNDWKDEDGKNFP